jgi:hypothetical protein
MGHAKEEQVRRTDTPENLLASIQFADFELGEVCQGGQQDTQE